ncbi:MAG: DNA cytosine methyltransferase [Saprospiraceae bacterium]
MRTIDLFAGCGGLSRGFEMAGFEVVAAYDYWQAAVNTYRQNFGHPIVLADLSDPLVQREIETYEAELIVGGPPCQDFSSAGKRNEDLGRGDLSVTFAEIVARCQPEYFVMENVERIVKSRKLQEAKAIFKDAGYRMFGAILDASLCGVPQVRKRFFLIGARELNPVLMEGIIQKNIASKPLTLREYMGKELDLEHYYRHPRSYARRAIFSIDEPSPTIRGVNRPVPKGYPGHPGDPVHMDKSIRPLTFEERARIQTFPSNFQFWGNKSEREQQIGNAVPVNLARFVARALWEYQQQLASAYDFAPGAAVFAMEPAMDYLPV